MIRIVVYAKGLLYTPIYTYTTHVLLLLLLLYDIATLARSEKEPRNKILNNDNINNKKDKTSCILLCRNPRSGRWLALAEQCSN